jgi:hypothetical protein
MFADAAVMEEGLMFLRRQTRHWRDELPLAMATPAIAPGAHDLLAPDAGRSGNGPIAVGCRASVSLQVTSSDLAVGTQDFHVFKEQSHVAGL